VSSCLVEPATLGMLVKQHLSMRRSGKVLARAVPLPVNPPGALSASDLFVIEFTPPDSRAVAGSLGAGPPAANPLAEASHPGAVCRPISFSPA